MFEKIYCFRIILHKCIINYLSPYIYFLLIHFMHNISLDVHFHILFLMFYTYLSKLSDQVCRGMWLSCGAQQILSIKEFLETSM